MPPKSATAKAKAPPKSTAFSTTKKPRGRPPKASSSSGSNMTSKNAASKKKKPGRPHKKVQKGGWIYTADKGTPTENEVVDKGFPWVTSIELDNHETTDFRTYTRRTALLVSVGKISLTEHSPSKFATTSEGALGGILDNQSEVFVITAGIKYKVTGLTKKCRYVLGLEVLDGVTRDAMMERGEIEWDEDVEADVVGMVTKEVRGEGDVGSLASEEDEDEDEEDEGEEEGEQEPATPSRFKHGDTAAGEGSGLVKEEEGEVVEKGDAGEDDVPEEGDVGEESEVKTPPTKKNGKGKGVKK